MKKIIAIYLCCMLFAACAMPVFAAADATMTLKADKQTLKPGEQVTITVDIKTTKECGSYGMIMEYDAKVFKVVDGVCKSGAWFKNFKADRGFAVIYLDAKKLDEKVGTVTLQVLPDAATGTATFTGRPSVKNGDTSLACTVNTLSFQIAKEQSQPQQTQPQQTQPTQPQQTAPVGSQPTTEQATDATQTTTEATQGATVETQEQTKPGQSVDATISSTAEEIITVGPTAPIVEKKNDILLIAVISVVVVAAMAVGGYFLLKKKQ